MIDIENYRGIGLYMIYLDPKFKNDKSITYYTSEMFHILPTLGDYGHILPEPGFEFVKEHGLGYFYGSEITGFQISNLRKVELKMDCGDGEGEYQPMRCSKPFYLETSLDTELDSEEMDELIVDGVYLYGYLTETFI